MRTLYTLVFVFFSLQASAFDLGSLNEAIAVESHDYAAASPQTAIPSEDEALDPLANWTHLDYEWDHEITASIPETGSMITDDHIGGAAYGFIY
jgi:hypothetical protein